MEHVYRESLIIERVIPVVSVASQVQWDNLGRLTFWLYVCWKRIFCNTMSGNKIGMRADGVQKHRVADYENHDV